jgi:hypothetical protein
MESGSEHMEADSEHNPSGLLLPKGNRSSKRKRSEEKDIRKSQRQRLDEECPAEEIAHYIWNDVSQKFDIIPIKSAANNRFLK